MKNEKKKTFRCINCGTRVKTLFKKYNEEVLKLSECENCKHVADKYVEYDSMILMIDLVLLRKIAYRHILFNVPVSNVWKLSVLLLLMETLLEWTLSYPYKYDSEKTPYLNETDLEIAGFQFYKTFLQVSIKTACFVLVLHALSFLYFRAFHREPISFLVFWKMVTVSSFGIFLFLPSLIWDMSLRDLHFRIVALYITLSQLLAYTAACDCPKLWSIFTIFTAYYCKSLILQFYDDAFAVFFKFYT